VKKYGAHPAPAPATGVPEFADFEKGGL